MKKPRIYLDNCCFNRPFDDPSQLLVRLETEAKLFIQDGVRNSKFELVWSYILERENDDNPFEQRKKSILSWKSRALVDVDESEEVIRIAESCHRLGLKPKDALHVACSIVAAAEFFITTDRGILSKPIDGIRVVNPIQFVQQYEEKQDHE